MPPIGAKFTLDTHRHDFSGPIFVDIKDLEKKLEEYLNNDLQNHLEEFYKNVRLEIARGGLD
jgi:hypothetical protein